MLCVETFGFEKASSAPAFDGAGVSSTRFRRLVIGCVDCGRGMSLTPYGSYVTVHGSPDAERVELAECRDYVARFKSDHDGHEVVSNDADLTWDPGAPANMASPLDANVYISVARAARLASVGDDGTLEEDDE